MIGASAARVVVDTVAVVDVDDLDRSLPSIARVIFCKAEEKVSSRFCHFVRPPPLRRRKKKVHFFPFSFCARERKRNSSSDLPLSARARVCLCCCCCCSLASSSSSSGENVQPKRRRCCGHDNLSSPNFPPEDGRLRETYAETVPSENAERNAGREVLEEL